MRFNLFLIIPKLQACANIRIRIVRTIIQIPIPKTTIRPIIRIPTKIRDNRRTEPTRPTGEADPTNYSQNSLFKEHLFFNINLIFKALRLRCWCYTPTFFLKRQARAKIRTRTARTSRQKPTPKTTIRPIIRKPTKRRDNPSRSLPVIVCDIVR